MSKHVPEPLALQGLLHDATEAYLHDLPRPLKRMSEFAFYLEAEAKLEEMIYEKFGAPPTMHPLVKHADTQALLWEWPNLMREEDPHLVGLKSEWTDTFNSMTPEQTKNAYLFTFDRIKNV